MTLEVSLTDRLVRLLTRSLVHIAKDWVIEQTLDRIRRDMEADEREYEEQLVKARKREETMRRAVKARVVKRQVR